MCVYVCVCVCGLSLSACLSVASASVALTPLLSALCNPLQRAQQAAAAAAKHAAAVQAVQGQLRGFQLDLADPAVVERVNARLGAPSFSAFMK